MDTEAKKLLGKPKHKINKISYVHNEAKIGDILQTNFAYICSSNKTNPRF